MKPSSDNIIATVVAAGLLALGLYFFTFITRRTIKGTDVSTDLVKEERETTKDKKSDNKVLNPAVFKSFTLNKITETSYNTKLFRFTIPGDTNLGLGIGRHISIRAEIGGNSVIRAYTPTSLPDQKGYFELLIKRYDSGKLSPYLHSLKQGDSIEVRGPVGRFKYNINTYEKIGLIAGGTGITPCLQLIRCILENSGNQYTEDHTCFVLFYQNRTIDDILMRETLDALVIAHPQRLQIIYFLSNPPITPMAPNPPNTPNTPITPIIHYGTQNGNERSGYISMDMLYEHMNVRICPFVGICGPSGFNDCIKGLLKKVGHTGEDSVYVW